MKKPNRPSAARAPTAPTATPAIRPTFVWLLEDVGVEVGEWVDAVIGGSVKFESVDDALLATNTSVYFIIVRQGHVNQISLPLRIRLDG